MGEAAKKLYEYNFEGISSADKKERLIKIYDKAIDACKHHDKSAVLKTLYILRSSIDYNIDTNIAENFSFLYGYFIFKIKNGQFDEVLVMMNDMRKTWIQSIKD
ncbi:MAG: hypothetical protein PVH88_00960 [Ignavibacteria bacterium]|jgi:flagellin-specific chaperone FliS